MKNKSRSLLIIDDNADMCYVLKEIFSAEGYITQSATSGREAVRLTQKNRFDIVLTDLIMEGMDGVETIKKLKKVLPEALYFVMTAYRSDDRVKESRACGVLEVFEKPFDIAKVIKVLNTAVGKAH
ncbi:MAG: response regulator [bacterium]